MKPQILRRRQSPASRAAFRLGKPWRLGFVVVAAALLMARGATQAPPIHLHQQSLLVGGGPTTVPCGDLPAGVTTWSAAGSPYILPSTVGDPNDPSVPPCPAFPAAGPDDPPVAAGVVVRSDSTLVIDGSLGPVEIFSHGAGISVMGGELRTIGTGPTISGTTNSVTFDAEPDVASWDGIRIVADGGRKGDASLSYVSIQHALTGINITSGATASPDDNHYGLTVRNSGIVVSYFDGIDAVNTPISITGLGDGRFGTLNNIGSFGIRVSFDSHAPAIPEKALDVRSMTFGSSVPFAETGCPPLQPCAAGTIGNDAIQATFVDHAAQPALISHNKIFRAGSYGIELVNPFDPIVQDNTLDCNGTGSAQPKVTCLSNVPNKFPPIYLNNATADLESKVTGNSGQEDGLEAIVFNGTVSSGRFTWKTASTNPSQPLGYVLNGSLNMSGGVFRVPGGSVVKASGGSLNLSEVTLDASDTGSKTFTSLRDGTAGIDAGCSVFVQVCSPPLPLPAGDWGGIKLVGAGANATIDHANIRYATVAITIANGAMSSPAAAAPTAITAPAADGPGFGLVVSNSAIGPTFADGIVALDTPIALLANIFTCPTTSCSGSSPIGNRGVDADFSGVGPLNGGLKLAGNHFDGSVNEAIRASALSGQLSGSVVLGPQPVSIRGNIIQAAGAFGINLQGAVRPTLRDNDVTGSGTGPVKYSAIYLNGLTAGDFNSPGSVTPPTADPAVIWGNTGSGNGLNAIVFHGTTAGATSSPRSLNWQTVGASGLLGYIVDGDLNVNGPLILNAGAYAPILAGTITVSGGGLNANSAIVTSLKEQAPGMRSCGSVFVPRVSGICPAQRAGDWGGFVLDPGQVNTLTATEIRYARTGITMDKPPVTPALTNLVLAQTSISHTTANGLTTQSPLSVTQGAFTNLGGQGIAVDLSNAGSGAIFTVDGAVVASTGQEGLRATGLGAQVVSVTNNRIDQTGAFGISLGKASILRLTNNTVTNVAAGFPAIYLNQVDRANFDVAVAGSRLITGNKGAGNGVDALAFDGSVDGDLLWQSARNTTDPTRLLGYILDGDLNMTGTLTVKAGDIVKIRNGTINLNGGHLRADDVANSGKKVFTSLADTTAGVGCPSALVPGCPAAAAGDWGGINLTGGTDGTLVNGTVRYASTGIHVDGGATSTFASSSFGLVVSGSSIGPSKTDGINAVKTPVSVTDSTISQGVHGISADFGGASSGALRLSGDRFVSTSAEAILGKALAGRPVWISDNHIQDAGTFGIRLVAADQLVLRNNNVSSTFGRIGPSDVHYPAIYLNNVRAAFDQNVRGNVGRNNGLDAIVFDGVATGNLTWITPSNPSWIVGAALPTNPLGFLLDGGLTVDGYTLKVPANAVVETLGGPITIRGGTLDANDSGAKTFTTMRDKVGSPRSCPSYFAPCDSTPTAGGWEGLVITHDAVGHKGSAKIRMADIKYATTGISIDSGPIGLAEPSPPNTRLELTDTTVELASKDGVNSLDTPISLVRGAIRDVGAHGVIASFFSPANCAATSSTPYPPDCVRLNVEGVTISRTAQDAIIANGLSGQPTVANDNIVTDAGTYGIRLVGADSLTLKNNDVSQSPSTPAAPLRYPAIYLNNVKADFETAPGTTPRVQGNHGLRNGLDAIVFHGETTNDLTWMTAGATGSTFGYLLDGPLTVNGTLTAKSGSDVIKILNGGIKINNGALDAAGATFTSLKDNPGMTACASVFVPDTCPVLPATLAAPGDWNGINIDAKDSTFKQGKILYASSGLTISDAQLDVSGATFREIRPGAAITSTGAKPLNVECSLITRNASGVAADTGTIKQSDVYNNSVADLVGNANLHADDDWLGAPLHTGGAAVNGALAAQRPVMTLTLTSANPLAAPDQYGHPAFGIGDMTLVAQSNRQMDTSASALPSGQFSLTTGPAPTFNLSVLGLSNRGWTTDHKWEPKPYGLDVAHANAGENALRLTGARDCVPAEVGNANSSLDRPDSNLMPPATPQAFSASILPTALSASAASGPYGGAALLTAHLTANGQNAANQKITFQITGQSAIDATTNNNGDAAVAAASLGHLDAKPYPAGVQVSYAGDPDLFYTPAPPAGGGAITAALTVTPASTTTSQAASSQTSTVYGQEITFSAAVTTNVAGGIQPGAADGTVTFTSGSTSICSASLGTGSTGNEAACKKKTLAAAATAYNISVVYIATSNGNFQDSSAATTLSQMVSQAGTTTATAASDTNPSTYGQTITLSATVSSTYLNPGSADGSVDFKEGSAILCSANLGSGSASNEAACTVDQLGLSAHTITAVFTAAPSGNYQSSTAPATLSQTVNAAPTATSTSASDQNPSTVGQTVNLSAAVTAANIAPGAGDGSVAFKDGGTTLCTANLGTGSTTNAAACSYTFSAAGTHTITAVFTTASANFQDSTSAATLSQTVNP